MLVFFGQARKRNTPENAGNRPFPESAFSGVLRFRVCFGALIEGNKEHPQTQHTRKRRCWEQSITMLGVILSDHIPGDLNLTLTLTANSN